MTEALARWSTWTELSAQPAIWEDWAEALDPASLRAWIAAQEVDEVWFCGAGSSAYVGEVVAAALDAPGLRMRAIATTDIVARPQALLRGRPLVVNFGRSGQSTETIGTLDALDALLPMAPRLNITCNAAGDLATRPAPGPQRAVILPEATHDRGFAMTSSFTTMLLTALALFGPGGGEMIARAGRSLRALWPEFLATAEAARLPERAVFLGAGPLLPIAREAALKVMELGAGAIPTLAETPLGLRHGPKSFLRGAADIVLFASPEAQAAAYEADLVAELRAQFPESRLLVVGPGGAPGFAMPDGAGPGGAVAVVLAQMLGVIWADRMGRNVDNPFAGQGTLTRVVSGVRLHPVTA